jgi:NodT family efflux transporter outer membrane factor (OMF) lipoprotein
MPRPDPAAGSPMRRGLSAAILAAALTAAGCASLPAPTPARQAKAPAAYAAEQAFAAPEGAWPADGWWKAYGDPQLDALIGEALKDSPTLAQAQARLVRARAAHAGAYSSLLPTLSANAQVQAVKQSYKYLFPTAFLPRGYQDYGQGTLNLNWELDFWGKNRAAVAAAASEAQAAAADAAEARLILTTDIASQYATLARLLADREVAERAAKVREETAGLAAQRVANGLDTRADLEQAKAGPPAARANIAALDGEIAQTRDALAALAGAGPDRGLALSPAAPRLTAFGLPANLRADLIGRRPDVVAARWRAEAAARRVGEARAAFYPNVDLSAYFGQQALHIENLVSRGAAIGAIGPALSLPIFEGGRLRAELRGAQADRDAAVAAYDAAVTEALRETADVAASQKALTERLTQSRETLAHDEEAYRVARLRYEGGLSTYQSVLLAEDAVLAQRQVVSDLAARAFALDVALVRALGGGFGSPKDAPHA